MEMIKRNLIYSKVGLSIESLYKANLDLGGLHIRHDSEGDMKWYDLIDTLNRVACMDGELCRIKEITSDKVCLINEDGETDIQFDLSHECFELATGIEI